MKKIIATKIGLVLLLGFLFVGFTAQEAKACEIDFEIVKGKKDKYKAGDIIVVKVIVTLTHRVCPIGLKKTKFKMNGLKVLGATDWVQTSTMVHERKLKIQIKSNKNGKLVFNAIRTCDKDGGFGSLKLEAVPIK